MKKTDSVPLTKQSRKTGLFGTLARRRILASSRSTVTPETLPNYVHGSFRCAGLIENIGAPNAQIRLPCTVPKVLI